jgi:hypothetical protein
MVLHAVMGTELHFLLYKYPLRGVPETINKNVRRVRILHVRLICGHGIPNSSHEIRHVFRVSQLFRRANLRGAPQSHYI